MKAKYKNKRDFYKAEAEHSADAAKMWRESAEANRKELEEYKKSCQENKKKRYSAIVYCTNCQVVSSVLISPGVKISEGDCVECRVRNCQLPVKKYPGMF